MGLSIAKRLQKDPRSTHNVLPRVFLLFWLYFLVRAFFSHRADHILGRVLVFCFKYKRRS